jgi:hypothetical protein
MPPNCDFITERMRGKPTDKLQLGTPQSVAEILRKHVMLELEGIDRMYT